jgi:hypothetical protein
LARKGKSDPTRILETQWSFKKEEKRAWLWVKNRGRVRNGPAFLFDIGSDGIKNTVFPVIKYIVHSI